jgi:hypothetical protein
MLDVLLVQPGAVDEYARLAARRTKSDVVLAG